MCEVWWIRSSNALNDGSDRDSKEPYRFRACEELRERVPSRAETDWLFGNPRTGRPYPQGEILRKAAIAAGIGPEIGWHAFGHTYRSRLDATAVPLKVQQELMRHASITNIKRQANSKVVGRVLKKENGEPITSAPQLVFPYWGVVRGYRLPQIPGRLMIPLVAGAGFEPATFGLWAQRATRLLHPARLLYGWLVR
jgi:hypothetical protein